MITKIVTYGFKLYTLPARVAYRRTAHLFNLPPTLEELFAELRASSEQVSRQVEAIFNEVDRDMSERAAHLSPQQRQQAADLALDAAEQHLSMAAVNMLRALWLATSARNALQAEGDSSIIEHEK